MGIGADHRIPGSHQSLFRQECMLDAHVSHVKIVGDPVNIGKIPAAFAVFCRFYIFIGDKMIHDQGDLFLIKNSLVLHFLHFIDGHGRCDIISQHQIQPCLDQLACLYLWKPRMGGQDFLRHCHSHLESLLSFGTAC